MIAMNRILVFIAASVATVATGCAQTPVRTSTTGEPFSAIVLPALPQKLDFAGEAVPLEYFDVCESLQKELLVTCYMHSRTFQTLLNTERYFSIIEPILAENGIPDDFKYLCMAESGLNPEAVSYAGAGGLWQFMPQTGKEYGLIVESQIDERYNVEKSTRAACRYILDAYERFGSWTLAAAAYNAGNAGVARRLEVQGTDDYYDTFLPQETLRYVFRILSLKIVCSDPEAYGFEFGEDDLFKPLDDYRYVSFSGRNIDWSEIAREYGTNYKMLRLLNPWIRAYEYANKSGITLQVKIPGRNMRRR